MLRDDIWTLLDNGNELMQSISSNSNLLKIPFEPKNVIHYSISYCAIHSFNSIQFHSIQFHPFSDAFVNQATKRKNFYSTVWFDGVKIIYDHLRLRNHVIFKNLECETIFEVVEFHRFLFKCYIKWMNNES